MNLRVVETEPANGFYNMAVDEALLLNCSRSGSRTALFPTLRFYTFSPPAITIGRFQKFNVREIHVEVNPGKSGAAPAGLHLPNVDIVRRITGGRAVFHNGDLTYSLIASDNNSFFGRNVFEGYKKISLIFRDALQILGIKAELVSRNTQCRVPTHQKNIGCFSSLTRYELQVNQKKILGSAQRIREGAILQQGTLMLSPKSQAPSFKWSQIGLSQIVGREIKIGEIVGAVKESMKNMGINIMEEVLTNREKELANKLVPKYQKEVDSSVVVSK